MSKVLIFGHQQPDTDSITSAIVLAYLKNKLGMNAEARAIGSLNYETKFVLKYFNFDRPKYLNDVKLQIKDVDYTKDCFLHEKDSIFKGYNHMNNTGIGTIPVVDDDGFYMGAATMKDVAGNLINNKLRKINTSYDNLLEALNGKEILRFDEEIKGEVISPSYRSTTFRENIKIDKESVLITGDRHAIIEYAVENSASLIVLTNGVQMKEEHLDIARKNNVDVISTEYDGLTTANLVVLSNYIKDNLKTEDIVFINENDDLTDVLDLANKKKYSNYPVLDSKGHCLGVFRVSMAYSRHPKQVILVDHNEKEQSVIGLEEAEILEIVDHHRIGNVGTNSPINFRNMPVGCTNTILYLMFKENNIDIPKNYAGLMLSGIISDTLLLTSPTTTDLDRNALKELASIAEIDYEKFAFEMFKAGSTIKGQTISEIIHGDFKKFMVNHQRIGVGQFLTMNTDEIMGKKNEIIECLNQIAKEEDYAFISLFVTDIWNKGSYIFYNENSKEIAENAFGVDDLEEGYFFEGMLSRKKQILPKLMNYLDN